MAHPAFRNALHTFFLVSPTILAMAADTGLLDSDSGAAIQGTFLLWDESPDDPDAVRLELAFEGRAITADSDVGYFDALSKIRQVIEPDGYRLVCLGASKGVYPSGMSRSMGAGG